VKALGKPMRGWINRCSQRSWKKAEGLAGKREKLWDPTVGQGNGRKRVQATKQEKGKVFQMSVGGKSKNDPQGGHQMQVAVQKGEELGG